MKTFLHYTKEQELDESFATRFPRLASAAQSTSNYVKKGIEKTSSGLEKAGDVVDSVRSSPLTGLLKKGAGGAAIGQALSGFSQQKKKKREEEMQDRRDYVAAKIKELGRGDPAVKNFYRLEADILNPNRPKSKQQRQKELDDHYTNYIW